jgi:6-phosphofructokinase
MVKRKDVKRVGMVFSGGPAPASNAVISAAAISFLDQGIEVYGFMDGFSNLEKFDEKEFPLEAGKHFHVLKVDDVTGLRRTSGILIRTSRANPGRHIQTIQDLQDDEKSAKLRSIYRGLRHHGVNALITIGGDDTLKTANYLFLLTRAERKRDLAVVHLPKTIDNDYFGIDFTFGHFTAVNFISQELQNLRMDAMSTNSWFLCEVMGRKAGWLAYGSAIAGEANMVISREDVWGRFDIDQVARNIMELVERRIDDHGKHYGLVVVAEGLADLLPEGMRPSETDQHGNIKLAEARIGAMLRDRVQSMLKERRGYAPKVVYKQLGYECRCAHPNAFDVLLGSQLGIGAYRAVVEEGLSGVMVSVNGQFDLEYVRFDNLIDLETLKPKIRYISPDSDFFKMARFLESRMEYEEGETW